MTSSNRMIARHSSKEEHDDFPTPPWATRALFEYVIGHKPGRSVWEPAAGRGHMVSVLKGEFQNVRATDIEPRAPGITKLDFTNPKKAKVVDWIITNPPYKLAESFWRMADLYAEEGVALLMRINWLQNPGRYARIFRACPPSVVAIFAGRMPAAQGKVIRGPAGFFQHCWVVWRPHYIGNTQLIWIPPNAQSLLERDEDYG